MELVQGTFDTKPTCKWQQTDHNNNEKPKCKLHNRLKGINEIEKKKVEHVSAWSGMCGQNLCGLVLGLTGRLEGGQ